ncbi:MAG: iron-sulfur cluster assembly scaffold protein [Candidatus Aenigmatarchaeota archaeon]
MKGDVISSENNWFYSKMVKEHFFNPRNIFKTKKEAEKYKADGVGIVGSPQCGDVMKMWIKVKNNKIVECRWMTFGCASAIASTSMLSVMVTEKGGMKLERATEIISQEITKRLGGLPARKIHCSVLGDKALREAINDYYRKTEQHDKIKIDGAKIIDKALKITDRDIENAVRDGARTFSDVQKITKVGIQDKNCVPEVKKLIEIYRKKWGSEHYDTQPIRF